MQLLIALYDQLQEYREGWAVGIFCVIMLGFRYSSSVRALLKSRQFFWTLTAFGLVLTVAYGLTIILVLAYPNYIDHYEATVAAISWRATQGHPIYPDLQTGDVYGVVYGPLLFITNGTILRLVPTIFGSKLAGSTAFLIALALTYVALKSKSLDDGRVIFLLSMIVIVTYYFFRHYAFWSRSEPFLILIGVLTIIAAQNLSAAVAATAIGILAGLAVDFKLHGALYAAPAAFAVFGTPESWRERIGLAALSTFSAVAAAILPFWLNSGGEGTTVAGYIFLMLMTAKHGLAPGLLMQNLLLALMMFTPIVVAWYFRRPTLGAFDSWFLGGLLVSLSITVIVASKPGAGSHHLLPLVAASAYGLLLALEAPTSRPAPTLGARELSAIVYVSLFVSYARGELMWTKILATKFATLHTEKMKIDELESLYNQYTLAEIGLSDNNHYDDTFYRTLLVFRGAPLHVDFGSWMDFRYAGVSETRIVGFLERCEVPVWILPEGAPFTVENYYTKLPLLSDQFRQMFFANYKLIQKGKFYQAWRC